MLFHINKTIKHDEEYKQKSADTLMSTHTHTYTHLHTHTYVHMRIHIRTHTYYKPTNILTFK